LIKSVRGEQRKSWRVQPALSAGKKICSGFLSDFPQTAKLQWLSFMVKHEHFLR
jgi:hypothetical protein